jgi:peptide-methionine (S)-S-oxide reductase
MSSYYRCSGKITIRRRACDRATTTGTQYRSAIYPLTPEQTAAAKASLARFQAAMNDAHDTRHITTEIATAKPFYYAEDDHQQYLYKNPHGYCGIGGIGVCLPPQ